MARKKAMPKAKEQVRIRFKRLANGNKSIYLDVFKDRQRSYEFLKMYLIPETDEVAKTRNKNTMKAATTIQAQRVIDLNNERAGIKDNGKGKMLFVEFLKQYEAGKQRNGQTTSVRMPAFINAIISYKGSKIMMKDLSKSYCLGFIDFIKNEYRTRNGKRLSLCTADNYCRTFNCILNTAVRQDIISLNPFTKIAPADKIKVPESQRAYLTIDEIKKLIATDCRKEDIKRAYMFCVYCGLRKSDVKALKWGQIIHDGDKCHVEIVMKKTRAPLYLPLSKEAQKWLPQRDGAADDANVFVLPALDMINGYLFPWAKAAGVTKHLTFHTARHTFATLMLTLGADLYTTSKLLGHTDISTTQIYAKIINEKKDEAVALAEGLFD